MGDTPIWQPLNQLAYLTSIVDEGVDAAQDLLDTLNQSPRWSLDRHTLQRINEIWSVTVEDLEVFATQGLRWATETGGTNPDVTKYCALVRQEQALVAQLLAAADAADPIEDLLEMSDLEAGIAAAAQDLANPPP